MENTYTYTARSAKNPARLVTFTLHDHRMSVGVGAPLEQVERLLGREPADEEATGDDHLNLWLKPLAVSLVERGTGPFRLSDVDADTDEDKLRVKAWFRSGGLGVLPLTLINGRVDNPDAAHAFVEELNRRKASVWSPFRFWGVLDYWISWIGAAAAFVGFFAAWRQLNRSRL
jgi:hypothetical protein